jgi:hypothetical protein
MTGILLSYRRTDTGGYAGRLRDALEKQFGERSVFQDVEAIEPGRNFENAINAAVGRCDVLLVLIGDTWCTERNEDGGLRLEDPRDFVQLEVASALRAKKHVLPVLVEGARMPPDHFLPANLKALARVQALELSDSRWEYDVERLVSAIRALTGTAPMAQRRDILTFVLGAIAAVGIAAAAYEVLHRPANVSGRWNLPIGSFWIVTQNGKRLTIEETDYDSKQVWKRGSGTIDRDRVDFALDVVYGGPRRYEGALRLSPDQNMMSGEVRDASSATKDSLALTRAR